MYLCVRVNVFKFFLFITRIILSFQGGATFYYKHYGGIKRERFIFKGDPSLYEINYKDLFSL